MFAKTMGLTLLSILALSASSFHQQPRIKSAQATLGESRAIRNVQLVSLVDITFVKKEKIADILELRAGMTSDISPLEIQVLTIKPGHSAEGFVLWEDEEELWLDSSYCEPDSQKKQIHTFNKPYRKSNARETHCSNADPYVKIKVLKQ
jgi:hypothetical protein